MLDRISLILTVIGGINWGLVGLFRFDFIAFISGGSDRIFARILYVIVAVAAIWTFSLLFRENRVLDREHAEKYS